MPTIEQPIKAPFPEFSLQQRALGHDMLHQTVGGAVLGFVLNDGTRIHQNSEFSNDDLDALITRFRQDPKEVLGIAREDLFAIGVDSRLGEVTRESRLGRYFDAYAAMTLELDHAAFPADAPGTIHRKVPDYLPDGFTDMGSSPSQNSNSRGREQIYLDKPEVFKKYRADILEIFSDPNIASASLERRKQMIATRLLQKVYYKIPYAFDEKGQPAAKWGGGKVNLSELSEGVCRHQAFAFQTLAQIFGLSSRLFKNNVSSQRKDGTWSSPGAHVANLLRINGQWYLADATQPDHEQVNGNTTWRPGVFKISKPPKGNETPTYEGVLRYSGQRKRYKARSNSYWKVER